MVPHEAYAIVSTHAVKHWRYCGDKIKHPLNVWKIWSTKCQKGSIRQKIVSYPRSKNKTLTENDKVKWFLQASTIKADTEEKW